VGLSYETLVKIFDGNWVDAATLLVAVIYAYLRRSSPNQPFLSKETGLRIAHGVALFPLALLTLASISSFALDAILHSHKIILSVSAKSRPSGTL
jgi:hypothetical protein